MSKLVATWCLLLVAMAADAQQGPSSVDERIRMIRERLGDALHVTADEVIAGHVEAVGGREAILSVETMMFKGRNLSCGRQERTLYRYYKQPDLLISSWSPDNTNYTVTDGGEVWLVTPEGRRVPDAWWATSFSHQRIDGNFIDYEDRGIEYEYVGLEGFDTEPSVYYHLRRSFPDGFVEELYFDVETGLLHGVWPTSSPVGNDPFFLFDYRNVDGILVPHVRMRVFEGASPPHVMIIDEIRVNMDYGEEFFTEYKKKPVLPAE